MKWISAGKKKKKRKERERETTTTHTQDKTNNAQARVVYVACARNKGLTRVVKTISSIN